MCVSDREIKKWRDSWVRDLIGGTGEMATCERRNPLPVRKLCLCARFVILSELFFPLWPSDCDSFTQDEERKDRCFLLHPR